MDLQELARDISRQINETREGLAKKMVEAGMTGDTWCIVDNYEEVVDSGFKVGYSCWPELIVNIEGYKNV